MCSFSEWESRWLPPGLLGHSISPAHATGGDNVEIVVRARDPSGLKRLARYVLRVGKTTRSGNLVLDPLSGSYRGVLSLPQGLTGPVTWRSPPTER